MKDFPNVKVRREDFPVHRRGGKPGWDGPVEGVGGGMNGAGRNKVLSGWEEKWAGMGGQGGRVGDWQQ